MGEWRESTLGGETCLLGSSREIRTVRVKECGDVGESSQGRTLSGTILPSTSDV